MSNGCCMLTREVRAADVPQAVYDVVIIGAGIAGLSAALSLDPKLRIAMVHKGDAPASSTYRAQGGVSAAVGSHDTPEAHMQDTLRVGQELCRREAVAAMVGEGPGAIAYLQSLGVDFNRSADDELSLTKEAGHSCHRVVHYYDATGRRISEALSAQLLDKRNIEQMHGAFLVDLLVKDGVCCGCLLWQNDGLLLVRAQKVIVATGGYSGIYSRTTNHTSVTGDGIAAAYRAGAAIADMEFVQFHPTAYTTLSGEVFLLTEALRGEGSVLLNAAGERFMFKYHPDGELAPRDEVSRSIVREMKESRQPVYLDARKLGKDYLADRFRQVYSRLAENNCFMEKDLIPVAPAAHYTIGGILTDVWGKTNIPGLYACGETAATGVHGANRLASNSLLEGVVFGRRAAQNINTTYDWQAKLLPLPSLQRSGPQYTISSRELEGDLDTVAGVVRNGSEMSALLRKVRTTVSSQAVYDSITRYEDHNACQLAILLLEAALLRTESRGTHFRADYPQKDDKFLGKHIIHQWGEEPTLHE